MLQTKEYIHRTSELGRSRMRGLLVLSQHRFQILQKQLVRKYTKTFIGRKKNVVRIGLVNIKVESPPFHTPSTDVGRGRDGWRDI